MFLPPWGHFKSFLVTFPYPIPSTIPILAYDSIDKFNFGVGKSNDDGLNYVATISTNIVPSNDLTEAITAFMEKRGVKSEIP